MDEEIIPAIPLGERIRHLVVYLLVGAAVVLVANPLLDRIPDYLAVEDTQEALRRLRLIMAGIGLALAPVILYCLIFAARIHRSGQFPPPGTRVWRDTRVVRGWRASLRVWTLVILALWLAACAAYAQLIPDKVIAGEAQASPASRETGS